MTWPAVRDQRLAAEQDDVVVQYEIGLYRENWVLPDEVADFTAPYSVDGYAETESTPAAGQFRVDTTGALAGGFEFHPSKNGQTVTLRYRRIGSYVWAHFFTTLQDAHDDLAASFNTHNHDAEYSPLGHDHAGLYAEVAHNHDADYAAIDHLHTGIYSPVGHNHDAAYSPLGHTHAFDDLTGKPTTLAGYDITDAVPSSRTVTAGTGLSGGGALSGNISIAFDATWGDARYALSGHNHSGVYSPVGHDHDATYAPISHTHDAGDLDLADDYAWTGTHTFSQATIAYVAASGVAFVSGKVTADGFNRVEVRTNGVAIGDGTAAPQSTLTYGSGGLLLTATWVQVAGRARFGTSQASTTGTNAGDLLLGNGTYIRARKADDSAWLPLLGLETTDSIFAYQTWAFQSNATIAGTLAVTGAAAFGAGLVVAGGGLSTASLSVRASEGFSIRGIAGSTSDFSLFNKDATTVFDVPTGTANVSVKGVILGNTTAVGAATAGGIRTTGNSQHDGINYYNADILPYAGGGTGVHSFDVRRTKTAVADGGGTFTIAFSGDGIHTIHASNAASGATVRRMALIRVDSGVVTIISSNGTFAAAAAGTAGNLNIFVSGSSLVLSNDTGGGTYYVHAETHLMYTN